MASLLMTWFDTPTSASGPNSTPIPTPAPTPISTPISVLLHPGMPFVVPSSTRLLLLLSPLHLRQTQSLLLPSAPLPAPALVTSSHLLSTSASS